MPVRHFYLLPHYSCNGLFFLFSVCWLHMNEFNSFLGGIKGEKSEGCGLFWYCLRDAVMLIRWYRRLSLYTINSLLYCGNISSFSSGWYTFRASSRLLISPPFSPPKSIAFIPSGAKTQKIKRIDDNKCNVRASKNAEQAFSTQRYLYICYRLFFLFSSVFPKWIK